MNTGQQCINGTGTELDVSKSGSDKSVEQARMAPADVIYRVATVTAVLYLLVSVL